MVSTITSHFNGTLFEIVAIFWKNIPPLDTIEGAMTMAISTKPTGVGVAAAAPHREVEAGGDMIGNITAPRLVNENIAAALVRRHTASLILRAMTTDIGTMAIAVVGTGTYFHDPLPHLLNM